MKKKIAALVVLMLMMSTLFIAAAFAADAEDDFGTGMHWKYTEETKTLEITGSGEIEDFKASTDAPWSALDITVLTIGDGVTAIGNNAFAMTSITTVSIPSAVTAVGTDAFPSTLTSVTVSCKHADTLADSLPATATKTLCHNTTHVAKEDATYTNSGMKEYWRCNDCKKLFKDEACTLVTTGDDLIIPKTDNDAPVLTNIGLDRYSVSQPASVVVMVLADDNNLSGIGSGSITFTNLAKTDAPTVSCSLTVNQNMLTGTLNFSETAPSGDYYISSITLTDKASNSRTYTYSTLDNTYKTMKITVKRLTTVDTVGTLTLNATSLGYGGYVTGTVMLKDTNGNALPNKTLDVYVGTTKTDITATTDENGKATFVYSNSVPGTYSLKAAFMGDDDYNASVTNAVDITFTTVPSTGDSYDIVLWCVVAAAALYVNAWYVVRRKKA